MQLIEDAISRQSCVDFVQAVHEAIAQTHAQFSQFSHWTLDLSEHAMGLEAHGASLYNAVAVWTGERQDRRPAEGDQHRAKFPVIGGCAKL